MTYLCWKIYNSCCIHMYSLIIDHECSSLCCCPRYSHSYLLLLLYLVLSLFFFHWPFLFVLQVTCKMCMLWNLPHSLSKGKMYLFFSLFFFLNLIISYKRRNYGSWIKLPPYLTHWTISHGISKKFWIWSTDGGPWLPTILLRSMRQMQRTHFFSTLYISGHF